MNRFLFLTTVLLVGFQLPLHCQSNPFWKTFNLDKKVSLRGIAVISEKECWVSGTKGTVAKTMNGGQTWTYLQVPDADSLDFRDIEVFNSNEVLLLSIGEGKKSKIYKSNDGGKSWKVVFQNTKSEGFFDAFSFWNENEGIMQGDPINSRLYLLKTGDRGESWQEIPENQCPKVDEGEYAFAASGSQITSLERTIWIHTGGNKSRVIKSPTKKLDWSSIETNMIQGKSSQGIFSIDFLNEQIGMAVGGDYSKENEGSDNIIITEDGGTSWSLISPSLDFRSCNEQPRGRAPRYRC